jgi:hypothetical protein
MMLSLLLALGAQDTVGAQDAVRSVTVTETTPSIEIPDGMMPAVAPYMRCLSNRRNAALKRADGLDDAGFQAVGALARAHCAEARAKAARKAKRVLDKRGSVTAESRAALIADTLDAVDGLYDSPALGERVPTLGR